MCALVGGVVNPLIHRPRLLVEGHVAEEPFLTKPQIFFFQGAGGAKRLAFARVHGDPGVWACSPQRVHHDLPGGAFH